MKHRIISFAAAAAVAFGFCGDLLPALNAADYTVFAAETASGTCGENLTWTLDDAGTLTISGTGEMRGYYNYNPWEEHRRSIETVVIEDGITSIGGWAFQNCTGLKSVTIPDSVTSIGGSSFYQCTSLKKITIPDSVISIYDYAFESCKGLTEISIPNSVTSIRARAFQYCTGLKSVTIPDSVTEIGSGAFDGCTGLTEITIPDSVTSIGLEVFYRCNSLTEITIPDSVTSIGELAFCGCAALTEIIIPKSVTSIGNAAFCDCTSLTSVSIPDSVTSIGREAFSGCNSLKGITIPNSVASIERNVFSKCAGLASVTIPDSVTSIAYYAFSGCTGLTDITILNPECSIDDDKATIPGTAVIHGYSGSTAQTYAKRYGRTFEAIKKIVASGTCGDNLTWTLDDAGTLTISGTGEMTNWSTYANVPWYAQRESIKKAVIEDGVTSIGGDAFYNCTGLTSVTIPDSVTSIGSLAFCDCTGLKQITIPDSVTKIGNGTFEYCRELKEITIPASVNSIGTYAFFGCTNLSDITILNTKCEIYDGKYTTPDTALIHGYSGSTAQAYAEKFGLIFEAITKIVASGTCGDNLTWTLDSEGTLTISGTGEMDNWTGYAMDVNNAAPWSKYGEQIKTVSVEDGATSIGDHAFVSCTHVTEYDLPDSVESIGKWAIASFELKTFRLPAKLRSIGNYAVSCNSLEEITIPDSVGSIGSGVFAGCSALTAIHVGSGNQNYCEQDGVLFTMDKKTLIFYPAGKTETAYSVPAGTEAIGTAAFESSMNLKQVTLPSGLKTIGDEAFCFHSLEQINLPDSLTEIGSYAFAETGIREIRIPDGVKALEECLFIRCHDLQSISIGKGVTRIGVYAFLYCSGLKEVTIPENVTEIIGGAFCNDMPDAESVTFTILNPDCKFTEDTTLEGPGISKTFPHNSLIRGYAGSTAESFAKQYGWDFEALEPIVTTTTATTTTSTTTTSTTTATTTEAVTTTTAVTTTEPSPPTEPFRCGGFNEWGFVNDRDQLGKKETADRRPYFTYSLKDADRDKLLSLLSDVEREQIEQRLNNPEMPVGGFCYGMSVSSILAYYGTFRPDDLVSNTQYLYDINADNLNDAVRSTVSYYQLLQYTKVIEQKRRKTEKDKESNKLKPLIESLEAGKPVLLGYTFEGKRGEKSGHAVVAYGIEKSVNALPVGSTMFRYDTHILIYDNITGNHALQNDLYINTSSWQWCIPRTDDPKSAEGAAQVIMNQSDYKSGCISLVLTEPELMNCCGLFGAETVTSDMTDEAYQNACARYAPLNGLFALGDYGITERAEDGSMNAAADEGKISFSADFFGYDGEEESSEIKASFDSVYGFYLAPKSGGAQAMSVSMEYEHYLMNAAADLADRIEFTPDAEIECSGTGGAYELIMVADKEIRAIDWHKLTVSGRDGGNLKMQFQPDGSGVILSGDSLKNVAVKANSYTAEAMRTFSTNYGSVRIYEIDEKTVGIAADTDGDGVYETEIPADTERQKGDADGDGEITNKDAQTVLVAYTDSLGTGVVDLPEAAFNAADVDGDGKVGAGDAQYILIYYTENTIAGNPKKWEDLLGQ